jgi:outer membrane receptor for ferrienterochelin and colicins
VGSVIPRLGYWRIGVFNITDAPYDRVRNYTDAGGTPASIRSHTVLTPRLYLTAGTQF